MPEEQLGQLNRRFLEALHNYYMALGLEPGGGVSAECGLLLLNNSLSMLLLPTCCATTTPC